MGQRSARMAEIARRNQLSDEEDAKAAIRALHGLEVQIADHEFPNMPGPIGALTGHGAWLVREGLRKAGFKITRA